MVIMDPLIEFYPMVEGFTNIEEVQPKPMNKFIPDWWRNIPNTPKGGELQTVKVCPSFTDWFTTGFVIPMWADVTLKYDVMTDSWNARMSHNEDFMTWSAHGQEQFVAHKTPLFHGKEASIVFKATCPWRIKTPPGWSVMQLPLFYHFNQEWSVLPGIIDTDIHHEINQQVLYHGNGDTILIERGTPFVQYIPFKRSDYDYEIREASEEDKEREKINSLHLSTKLAGGGAYRMRRKDFKKEHLD
jgi:hypothetical protein